MIHKNGDYYIYEQPNINSNQSHSSKLNQTIEAVQANKQQKFRITGNVKENINAIRMRFQQLKKFHNQSLNKANQNIFQNIFKTVKQNKSDNEFQIELYIPEQILKIDQRISIIQKKLNPDQIFRRKIQNKGPIVERIKALNQKLQKILQKSSQIIIGNIQSYCSSLQDKQQYLKILFLRQAQNKTKGMKQQILIVEKYLQRLNQMQIKIKSIEPNQKIIANHSQIISLRSNLKSRISQLFNTMKSDYEQILKQIQTISV